MTTQTAGQQQAIQRSQRGEPLSSVDVFNLRSMGMGTGGGASSVTAGQKAAIAALQNAGGDTSQLTDVQRFNIARFQEQQGGVISSDAQGNYYLSAQPYVNPTPQTQSGISQPATQTYSGNAEVTPISRYQQLAQTAQTYLRTNIPYVSPVIQRVYEAPERARERGFTGGYGAPLPYPRVVRVIQNPSAYIEKGVSRVVPDQVQTRANVYLNRVPYLRTIAPVAKDIASAGLSFELVNPEVALLRTTQKAGVTTLKVKPQLLPRPEPNVDFFAKVDENSMSVSAKSQALGQKPSYIVGRYAVLKNPLTGEPIGLRGNTLTLEPKPNAVKVTLSDALAGNAPLPGSVKQVTKVNDLMLSKGIKDVDASVSMGLNVRRGSATFPTLSNKLQSRRFDIFGYPIEAQKSTIAGLSKPINENTFSFVGGSARMRIARSNFFNKKVVFTPRIKGIIKSTVGGESEEGAQVLKFVKSNFPASSLDQAAKQSIKQTFAPVMPSTALSSIDRTIIGNAKPLTYPKSSRGEAATASLKQQRRENAKFFTASPQSVSLSQRQSQSSMMRITQSSRENQRQIPASAQTPDQIFREKSTIKTLLGFGTSQVQNQIRQQRQFKIFRFKDVSFPYPVPKPTPPPTGGGLNIPSGYPSKFYRVSSKKPRDSFFAISRRRGKDVFLGSFPTPQQARGTAENFARNTLAATVKVKSASGRPVFLRPDKMFSLSKRNPFSLVQRRGARLSSRGERNEIQNSKNAARNLWGFKKRK